MVTMSKRYLPDVGERALHLALDHLDEHPCAYAAAHAIGPMVDLDDRVRTSALMSHIAEAGMSDTWPPQCHSGCGLRLSGRPNAR